MASHTQAAADVAVALQEKGEVARVETALADAERQQVMALKDTEMQQVIGPRGNSLSEALPQC